MDEKEYIEREAVLADELTHCLPYSVGKAAGRVVVFAEDIEAIPAADVALVVHGWWIEKIGRAKCSACADECWASSVMEYRYCPNCGAKMDGGNR